MEFLICPSILSADIGNLSKEIELIKKAGAFAVHIDVMDGQFVNNISFGTVVVAGLRNCDLLLDVHLMVAKPLKLIKQFVEAGATFLTFHVECLDDVVSCVLEAKNLGCGVGLAIKPSTDISVLEQFLYNSEIGSLIDLVMIMTVEPGFSGQEFIPQTLHKIEKIRKLNCKINIGADGGINLKTVRQVKNSGANWLVSGSAIFSSKNYSKTIEQLKQL